MAADEVVFCNGAFLPWKTPLVRADDLGLLAGDGVFETLRLMGGRPMDFDAHMDRLARAAALLQIEINIATVEYMAATMEVARRNGHRDGAARVVVTRGPGGAPEYPFEAGPPGLIITTRQGSGYAAGLYEQGASLVTASIRQNADSPLPRLKTLSCLERLVARREAEAGGATEALLLNTRGEVAEGSRSNIFCVRGGRIATPHEGANILTGVTRWRVMAQARERGTPVCEGRLLPADLDESDEIFLTSSLMGVLPVTRLDGRPVGGGEPGPVALGLREAYEGWLERA